MGELPKLFGKAFAVGFLLPAAAFALALAGFLTRVGAVTDPITKLFRGDLVGVTVAVAVLWLGAVALMALNRPILRAAEGYGALNPLQMLRVVEVRRFRDLSALVDTLEGDIAEAEAANAPLPDDTRSRLAAAYLRLVEDYPDQEEHVLPTRFGNVMRAYEVYPRVIYGLEGIQGWNRLVGVMPPDFRTQIEDAKSQTDFWINIWGLSFVFLAAFTWRVLSSGHLKGLWMAVVAGLLAWISIRLATTMAREWGALVMSAFDLHRAELASRLGLDLPRSIDHERTMWTAFSQAAIYRSTEAADQLGPYRRDGKASKDA